MAGEALDPVGAALALERAQVLGHRIDRIGLPGVRRGSVPEIQRAYSQNSTNPENQAAAIASRFADAHPTQRFNVSTVAIKNAAAAAQATSTRKSVGGGVAFHAERRALSADMTDADVAGFSNADGAVTGAALDAGGIASMDVYTEFPPCPEACEPYLRAIEERLDGNVAVTFSDELEDWFDSTAGQRTAAWNAHLEAITPEPEEEDDADGAAAEVAVAAPAAQQEAPAAQAPPLAQQAPPAVVAAEDEDADVPMDLGGDRRTLTLQIVEPNLATLNFVEAALGDAGVGAFDWDENENPFAPPSFSWDGGPSAALVRQVLIARGLPIA